MHNRNVTTSCIRALPWGTHEDKGDNPKSLRKAGWSYGKCHLFTKPLGWNVLNFFPSPISSWAMSWTSSLLRQVQIDRKENGGYFLSRYKLLPLEGQKRHFVNWVGTNYMKLHQLHFLFIFRASSLQTSLIWEQGTSTLMPCPILEKASLRDLRKWGNQHRLDENHMSLFLLLLRQAVCVETNEGDQRLLGFS